MASGDDAPRLVDGHGRRVEYLRLSVTERCNFRCSYCQPHGAAGPRAAEPPLRLAEIDRLVRAAGALGITKVRVTGGEPTLRPDVVDVVATIAAAAGVRHVGITTNGWRLKALVRDLADAGLTCLNVSVDSLDPRRFAAITGAPVLSDVLEGIATAVAAGISRVKVNAVLLAGGEADVARFLAWTRDAPITVRFIELMDVGPERAFFARHHAPTTALERVLVERGWTRVVRARGSGPSIEYRHDDHAGRVGVIAPWRHHACADCNRLRVSATGALRPCLFDPCEIPVRHLLQSDAQHSALLEALRAAVTAKPAGRRDERRQPMVQRSLASIGG